MKKISSEPVITQVLTEIKQGNATRATLFEDIENLIGCPVVTFFTSFKYPVMIEDDDADMLQGIFQKMDLSKGLALIISSPGGDGLAAERIINICRNHSGTGEYLAIVPGKAKSAATMVCFGANKIMMGATSEIGPIDPQMAILENNRVKRFSVCNIVKSYDDLFKRAVKEKGNLEPYLQQLANYDEREIEEMRTAIALSEDIAVKVLASGMMHGVSDDDISKKIKMFLTPDKMKSHGRPIYKDMAASCGLNIDAIDLNADIWEKIYELYIRTEHYVSTRVSKCIESKDHSFVGRAGVDQYE